MFKFVFLVLAVVAVASAQLIASPYIASSAVLRSSSYHGNGYAAPYAYSAYQAPISAYSAYQAPISAYSAYQAPISAYSAYSAPISAYSSPISTYSSLPGYGVHPYR